MHGCELRVDFGDGDKPMDFFEKFVATSDSGVHCRLFLKVILYVGIAWYVFNYLDPKCYVINYFPS